METYRYDAQHPAVQGHVSHLTIAEEELKAAKRAAREAAADGVIPSGSGSGSGKDKGKGKELVIEEVWKPSGASISFWEAAGVEYVFHPSCSNYPTNLLSNVAKTNPTHLAI
jgi:translation initiation factor 2D